MTTFVLIHGAYQGGWIFKPTVEQLIAKGHRVFAPTLDGCGERKGQVRAGITPPPMPRRSRTCCSTRT